MRLHLVCVQEFLEAMSAYYYGDTPKLTDEEFSLLKEELIWNGSKVGPTFQSCFASAWLQVHQQRLASVPQGAVLARQRQLSSPWAVFCRFSAQL